MMHTSLRSCFQTKPKTGRFTVSQLTLLIATLSVGFLLPSQALADQPTAEKPHSDSKPNVLLIFADDQCFDTINALGNEEVVTPNLDRLARAGTSFSNAYNMGGWNGAICIASRTMMNTGRFLWRAHAVSKSLKNEASENRMIPQLMSQAGYETFVSGKWHVSINANQIFDHAVHIRPGMPKTVASSYQRPNSKNDWSPYDKTLGGFWEGGKHWSEVLADDAETFLKQSASNAKPFYMYLAFNAPHDPRQAPKQFVDMYDREKIQVPQNFLPENPHMNEMEAGKRLRDEKLAPWPRTKAAVQLHRQEYYALITHMDVQIGRILDALEATGQAENTLIVMTADHGLACGQHGLLGKQNMYEHSLKAPLLVVGPAFNIPAGKQIDTPVYIQDFVATALDAAKIKQPAQVEFKSLLPLIRGEKDQQYDAIYAAYLAGAQRMIRKNGFKLIRYPKNGTELLFNLHEDPQELNNLVDSPAHQTTLKMLRAELEKAMTQMDDPLLKN